MSINNERSALIGIVSLMALTVLVGTLFYHHVEGWRYLDALYFSVMTLTTVGFGDFVPQTDAGKLFTAVYVFLGVGIIFGTAMAVGARARDHIIGQ